MNRLNQSWLMVASGLMLIFSQLGFAAKAEPIHVKLLGVNDFHGQLIAGRTEGGRPVGGAAVLASYLQHAASGHEDHTIITLMGDQVGASPAVSTLLNHEPSLMFFNSLANAACQHETRMDPHCNLVATLGNHEFDQGQEALRHLIDGNHTQPTDHWINLSAYPGANFPYISANIVDENTGATLLPPYVIKEVAGLRIGFIGAVTRYAADSILPDHIKGIQFINEAESINRYVPVLKQAGVKAIVVVIHEGGEQKAYEGKTQAELDVSGAIKDIVSRLDDAVEVVMAGHTHQFMNTRLKTQSGHEILVAEAKSYSAAFAEVDLSFDPKSKRLLDSSAEIHTTYADQWPGNLPNPQVTSLVDMAEQAVTLKTSREVANLAGPLTTSRNPAGESDLGNLLADAYRQETGSDIALMNSSGIRANLKEGVIRWGDLYSVVPFSSKIVQLRFTGKQVQALLEQQFTNKHNIMFQVAGLTYRWDNARSLGEKVVAIRINGQALEQDRFYTLATTDFMASGGSGFTVMKEGRFLKEGGIDIDLLSHFLEKLPQPVHYQIEGRIQRLN